ncbi:MAG TPA: tetratricopeptide repeat protein [Pyrinomonadaceae bacterium]|jgi:Tfp pilus assembly protein PilF|nr:tetratricopeptide repeat protein [Pyrinomonadaceae bacterium]
MKKRRLIAVLIAFIITVAATAMWSASTIVREGDPDAIVLEDSGSEAGTTEEQPQKKGGNKVVKVLTAPFKAVGRLFGRGGNDQNKIERMTEKDAERFESVGVTRIEDARTVKRVTAASSAREHLDAGREFLLNGAYSEAVSELSTAVSLDPKLTEAHNLLGVAFDKKGFGERAKESFERAVKLEEDAETLNNLGFALYQSGNYRAAVDRLKRAAKLAPGDERILNNLGLAYCRLGKIDEAYKAFTRATGPVTGNINTAKMLERFGREDDAIRYYESARSLDPNNTFALRRLADLYNRVGRTADSEAARAALAIASNGTILVTGGK